MAYVWDFYAVARNADLLLAGLGQTLLLSVCGIAVGVALGGLLAAMRLSGRRPLIWTALAFTEFYRNTPPLVHFFWFFYGLPIAFGLTLPPFPPALPHRHAGLRGARAGFAGHWTGSPGRLPSRRR